MHAVDFLVETLASAETPITIAAVGPLTNLALAFRMRPGIVSKIGRLAIMGGGIAVTNISASAEANIFWDPEAADVVFRAGVPIELFPLDATHMAPVTSADVAPLGGGRDSGGPDRRRVPAGADPHVRVQDARRGGRRSRPRCPGRGRAGRPGPREVRAGQRRDRAGRDPHPGPDRGRSAAAPLPRLDQPKNARVAVWADRERFLDFLTEIFHSQESAEQRRMR